MFARCVARCREIVKAPACLPACVTPREKSHEVVYIITAIMVVSLHQRQTSRDLPASGVCLMR